MTEEIVVIVNVAVLEERVWRAIRPYFAAYGSSLGATEWKHVIGYHARCVRDIVRAIRTLSVRFISPSIGGSG